MTCCGKPMRAESGMWVYGRCGASFQPGTTAPAATEQEA